MKEEKVLMLFEIFGWAAAGLTFMTYYQKTMVRLRILGILSNLCFVAWSVAFSVYPVLVLHSCLLPVNIFRFIQIQRLKRRAQLAIEARVSPLDWLRPYAKLEHFQDGEYVFRIGDKPDRLYYLLSGSILFEELEKRALPGELFGEVAFLTSKGERTASARCEDVCEVFALDAADLAMLSLQHPAFNFYVMRVMAERLTGGHAPRDMTKAPFTNTRIGQP